MTILEIVWILAVIGVMVGALFIIRRIEKLFDRSRRGHRESSKTGAGRVKLSTDMTDEALIKKIRAYEKENGSSSLSLDSEDGEDFKGFDGKG